MRTILRAQFLFVVVLLSIVLTPNAFAQDARNIIQRQTLRNGLDVIVIASSSVPIVTVEITVKNGAFTEPPELNGLSHLYEHMFFKGNAVIPNQEAYLARMRELGIVFNGTTSSERVNYFFTLPSDKLADGLVFMRDAITTPKFDANEFEKEKQVVLGEVDRNESSPYYWFGQEMDQRLWFAHPTRKDPLGDRKTITEATIAKMETMKNRYYVPNNSVLVISGDVDSNQAFRKAEEVFGSWKRGPDPFVATPVPEHPPLKGNRFFVLNKDVQVPYLQYSWHGPRVDQDANATYAADVLSYILGQPNSKFQKTLVESGITLGVGLSYYTQRHTGPISVTAQATPDKLNEAIPAVLREIEKMTDPAYFTDEQLENAKTILTIQDLYGREQISGFTHTVSFWWAVAGLDYYLDYIPNLKAVTRQDIARYVRTYILGKPYVAGVLMSEDTQKKLGFSDEVLRNLSETANQ